MKTIESLQKEIESIAVERRTVSVLLSEDLAAADRILRTAKEAGVGIRTWSIAHTERPGQIRLNVAPLWSADRLVECLEGHADVLRIDIMEERDSMGFAMFRVWATGADQDEASRLVGAAGGRLLAMDDEGFVAQVSSRTERLSELLDRLSGRVEVVRIPLMGLPK